MMDTNFERAEGRRPRIDRPLLNREWPVRLQVMGKIGRSDPYLSMPEGRGLHLDR